MKLRYRFGRMVLMIVVGAMITVTVWAKPGVEANREWVRSAVQDQVNQGNLDRAIGILNSHLAQDSEDSESWARLALLQSRTQRCEEARGSLERASTVATPGMRNAYVLAADHLRSKGCQTISDGMFAASASPRARTGEWGGSAKLRLGHDSNVMLLSDSVATVRAPESSFLNPLGQIEYRRPFELGQFEARSVTSYTSYLSSDYSEYTSSSVTDYNSLSQSLSAEWRPKGIEGQGWDRTFGTRLDGFFVNSDGMRFFSWMNTAYAQFSHAWNESSRLGFEVPIGYQKFAEDTAPTSADKRDGAVLSPSAWYAHRFSRFVWNTSVAYSQVMASGENYRMRGAVVSTGISGNFASAWRGRGGVSYSHNDYFDNPSDRKDDRLELAAGLVYLPHSKSSLSFGLDLVASDNRSNIAGANYKRNTVMGQVDYAF